MQPTLGRIVHYRLSAQDAEQINRRRTNGAKIHALLQVQRWPEGAQAHIGNAVEAGMLVAMVVTAVWSPPNVNGQCLLDGNDTFWATTVAEGTEPGQWSWPEINSVMADQDALDLDCRFSYHAPKPDQVDRYAKIRPAGKSLAQLIIESCPPSRERSLALTKIEEAVMWANASIARREPHDG